MVDLSISLIGSNGDVISLDSDSDFILTTGVTGFGMPATSVRIDESAANGGVWRNTKRGIRDIDLPITILGTSRSDVENKLRRLSRLISDRKGPTTIRAAYNSGEVWSISGHYVGGAESQYGDTGSENWVQWTLSFQCPDPFWIRNISESYTLRSGVTGRSIIPNLAELRLSSSQAIGEFEVENSGDVESAPTWQLAGPLNNIVVTSSTGESWSYETLILLGTTVTIDTYNATVTDALGNNLYGNLGTAPKLFTIPAGSSEITVTATDATADSSISMFFRPRKEVLH